MSYIKKRAKQYYTIVSKRVRLKKNLNLDCQSHLHLKTNVHCYVKLHLISFN